MAYIEKGFFILIESADRKNIIFPTKPNELAEINNILRCSNSRTNLININSHWFEKRTKANSDGSIETVIFDITEHVLDPLTNIFKYKYFESLLLEYIEYALDSREQFAVVSADLDNLKDINNTYGHNIGDLVLKRVGETFINSFRLKDSSDNVEEKRKETDSCKKDIIFTRMHGDEFAILLPNISLEDSKKKIEAVKQSISNLSFNVYGTPAKIASMSFGIFHVNEKYYNENNENTPEIILEDILSRADKEMYLSKGKNKGITYIYGIKQ